MRRRRRRPWEVGILGRRGGETERPEEGAWQGAQGRAHQELHQEDSSLSLFFLTLISFLTYSINERFKQLHAQCPRNLEDHSHLSISLSLSLALSLFSLSLSLSLQATSRGRS
jgi:hypothetical protein